LRNCCRRFSLLDSPLVAAKLIEQIFREGAVPKSFENEERVYHTIRRMLLEGRVKHRKDLSRRKLAEKLGVSPGCVHAALGRLEVEGLLLSRPQSGTFLRQLNIEEYFHHCDLRELIEPYAARRAAAWITPAQLAVIEHSCDEITAVAELERASGGSFEASLIERSVRAEHLFHGTIMEASRNPTAAHFIENLRIMRIALPLNQARDRAARIEEAQRTDREHRAILAALRSGDGEAAHQHMLLHLQNGARSRNEQLSMFSTSQHNGAAAKPGPSPRAW
jgi:DNA-binding GntR family transcriptional regulator